jgi:transcription elongation factor Elf1
MRDEIITMNWDGSCPTCGEDSLVHTDIDYEICDNGWVVETFECENCGQMVEVEYSLTFECIKYKPTAPVK